MRQRYIVTYDVRNTRRLRRTFRLLCGYGDHLQLSVFRCDLDAVRYAELKAQLVEVLHLTEDQVLLIDVGPAEGRGEDSVESIGVTYTNAPRGPTVV